MELSDDIKDTVKNPAVIFEILSPLTEDYDMGKKFFYYIQIASLKEYVMIDSTKPFTRIGRKQADNAWKFEEYKDKPEALHLNSIDFTLSLQDIYKGVL